MKKSIIKKIVCFISALTMALILPNSSEEKISAVNSTITYYSFDAKTGEFIDDYTLNSLGVIGSIPSSRSGAIDDRVLDWTKYGVVKLFGIRLSDNSTGIGTGFVVDKHVIATAAHCVYGVKIDKIKIFSGNPNDYIEVTPVECHLSKKFCEEYPISKDFSAPNRMDAERESRCHDYALITVEEDLSLLGNDQTSEEDQTEEELSEYMCFNLGVATDSAIENNTAVTVTGFPSTVYTPFNKVNYDEDNMYSATGTLIDMNEYISENPGCYFEQYQYLQNKDLIFCYDTYASSGNSGGPVYATESYNGKIYYTVIGINTAGGGSDIRMGVRMTTDLLHFYFNNANLNW